MSVEKAETKPPTIDKLYVDQVKFYLDKLQGVPKLMEELEGLTKQAREQAQEQVAGFALSLRMNKIDEDALESFFKHPYPKMEPARDAHGRLLPETWRLVVPRFIPLNIGYLESQDEGWNYFRVNRYMDWFGEIPDFIKKQIGWKEAPDLKIAGEELVGAPEAVKEAVKKYKGLVTEKDGKVLINKNRAYELIVQLLKDGVKPFLQRPVQDEDRVNRRCDFTPRDYQKEILNTFYKYSSIGVFIPPSTGKTILGLLALTSIKGPHLVVVPTVTLVEQWEDHIQAETDLKLGEDVIVCTYQTAISKQSAKKWKLIIFDEVHHMPAKTFIKLSLLQRDYSLGLSATPYREDEGGEELIFALTGQPTGLAWQYFKELKIIKNPVCHVWIEKNVDAKMKRLDELMQEKRKTIIFSDSLELGERVAKRYAIPFVSGASEERLKTLKDNQATVISRVGDEGVSLPDIERVIEISWLFGSRRQELQRFTRLLHGRDYEGEGEAHVLMTMDEYVHDKKRLFSIMDRAFKVVLHREGISDKVIEQSTRTIPAPRPIRERAAPQGPMNQIPVVTPEIPAAVMQRLPGITRTLERLSSVEKAVAVTMLGNPSNSYSTKELSLATGYSIKTLSNLAHYGKLIDQGLIRKEGEKYRSAI